ncbi:hypothetical protein T261_5036 [Streptomyces lydicus]|nr:hypothetical protein T261_5036 [Streptomyces lydicus]
MWFTEAGHLDLPFSRVAHRRVLLTAHQIGRQGTPGALPGEDTSQPRIGAGAGPWTTRDGRKDRPRGRSRGRSRGPPDGPPECAETAETTKRGPAGPR